MTTSLTAEQQRLLRRCSGGLRVWETGRELARLRDDLGVLCRMALVSFEEPGGYETTAQGEACLARLDP